MTKRLITIKDITGLSDKHAAFVIEYIKDYDARRAAEATGHDPDYGYKLRKMPAIERVIQHIRTQQLESSQIDAEWTKMELVDNHLLARQAGKLSQSNTALALIAKHASVDAFAAEKVFIANDEMIRERLIRARNRANQSNKPDDDDDDKENKDVSFI
jgi:hypothetical protein